MKNLISWVDIPAADINRAVKFYNKVLNLNLEVLDCGPEKMACFPTGEGAISTAPDFKPSKDGSIISFNTPDSIEETTDRILENGGKVITPKTKIEAEGRGYFAVFMDCEGNKVGLYCDN